MGSSTAIRLGCGFFSFVVMARFLGPELFGTVMYWLSVATIVSMVANFGLTPYLLKEIGASPEKSHHMMNRVFSVKLLLSFFIVLISFCATFYIKNASVFFYYCWPCCLIRLLNFLMLALERRIDLRVKLKLQQ